MCTLMLIDNSQQFEQSMRRILSDAAMDVNLVCVADNKAAQQLLEEGGRFDAILSDIDQPTSGGVDFFCRLIPDYPQIRRVVVSSSQRFEMVKYAINLQMNGYLTKPLDHEEVLALLLQLIPDAFVNRQSMDCTCRKERDEIAKRRLINEVIAIVERDVDQDIGLEYISQKVHISSCYLSALFREVMGQGLIFYITNYRMNLASSMLLNSNLKIFEIARRVGYRSTPYFCTVFKSHYSVTPSQYREQNYNDKTLNKFNTLNI